MGKFRFINFAVFIIFFGAALINAFQKQSWAEVTIFVILGALSFWADSQRKT